MSGRTRFGPILVFLIIGLFLGLPASTVLVFHLRNNQTFERMLAEVVEAMKAFSSQSPATLNQEMQSAFATPMDRIDRVENAGWQRSGSEGDYRFEERKLFLKTRWSPNPQVSDMGVRFRVEQRVSPVSFSPVLKVSFAYADYQKGLSRLLERLLKERGLEYTLEGSYLK